MVLSNTLNIVGPTIDMIWVGKLGAASVAGVGVAGIAVQLVIATLVGLFIGLRALVARFVGAGDEKGASYAARQAFIISAVISIILATIGIFLAEEILGAMGLEPDAITEGAAYMRIMFASTVVISFRLVTESIMQASGDAMTPLKLIFMVRAFHALLCPFFIFGWWTFPEMGVSGAAISNIISQSIGLAFGFWILLSGRSRLKLSLRNFSLDLNIIWRMVRIGIPASIMAMQSNFGHLALMRFMAPFGTVAVAAHTIAQRVDMMLFMPAMGLGVAAGVLVGQNLGARQPARAEKSGWLAVGMGEIYTIAFAIVISIWPEHIVHIFNSEAALVETASSFLRIAAVSYLFAAFIPVLMQATTSAGDTIPPMLFSIVLVWMVQVPMAFLLSQVIGSNAQGVRWAMVTGTAFGAIAFTTYFKMGRWKRKRI